MIRRPVKAKAFARLPVFSWVSLFLLFPTSRLFGQESQGSVGAVSKVKQSGSVEARPTRVDDATVKPNSIGIGVPLGYLEVGQVSAQIAHSCQIAKPEDNAPFPLEANNTTETNPISFQAKGNAQITWSVNVQYATSGGKGSSSSSKSFMSNDNSAVSQQFQSVGGQAKVIATCGSPNNKDNVTITIPGSVISQSTIASRLYSLYASGNPTPGLMTGIARKESTTMQFKTRSLFGLKALWPNESYDKGSHIGLMMVKSSMQDAFDWTINTQDGVTLFKEKIGIAKHYERQIQIAHSGLPDLTALQLENMAILLYGPYAPADDPLNAQYYAPACVATGTPGSGTTSPPPCCVEGTGSGQPCVPGSWQWIENVAGVKGDSYGDGITYVADVRNDVQ